MHLQPSTLISQQLPWVRSVKQIGQGGQKVVFRAEVDRLGVVALKVIRDNEEPERVAREVLAAADLKGEYFPRIYRTGELDVQGSPWFYIVEEFVQGTSLRSILQQGPLGQQRCFGIALQLLKALCVVHEAGLVHRDIKPENIMVEPSGRLRLLDFGIARHLLLSSLTADAAAMGPLTPGYGAPEQIRNEKRSIGPRTDLFAWAVVFYECWTGWNPFVVGCTSPGQALGKTLSYDPPLLPAANHDLANLVHRCLSKAVHRRPPSTAVVLAELERLVGESL